MLASYSITDERRAVVGQAGPYYITGQQLLVRSDSDIDSLEDVKGTEVCSVTGSTSLENIEAEGATPRGFDTYSECVDQVLSGAVDAMTTDGAILLGYAAEHPDELKVVVEPFSEERYGVGYSLDHPEMCQWIVDTHHRRRRRTAPGRTRSRPRWARRASTRRSRRRWTSARPPDRPASLTVSAGPAPTGGAGTRRPKEDTPAVELVFSNFDLYLSAFRLTIGLFLVSGALSLVLGTLLAAMRVGPVAFLSKAATTYITLVRNTPLLIIFVFVIIGLPKLGILFRSVEEIGISSFFFRACLALTLYTSTFVAEAIRSGHQRGPAGAGGGRAGDRAHVRRHDDAGRAAAGLPGHGAAAGQRLHRAAEEHLRGRTPSGSWRPPPG